MHSKEEIISKTVEEMTIFINHVKPSLLLGLACTNFIAPFLNVIFILITCFPNCEQLFVECLFPFVGKFLLFYIFLKKWGFIYYFMNISNLIFEKSRKKLLIVQ